MAKEEKHWEVENSNMTMSHKKDGKLWLSYFQCRVEIQMKILLIIVFCRIENKKIEEKGNVQKTLTITLFDVVDFGRCISLFACVTFQCYVALWASAPFGHSNWGRSCSKLKEIRRKKEMTMIQIKRWNEKVLCYEWKGVTQEEIIGRQTKLWLGRNYLKIVDKEIAKHIDIKRKKDV